MSMSMSKRYVRNHPASHMAGLGEFRSVTEPVAVVLRNDGSIDAYGLVAVVDQTPVMNGDGGPGICDMPSPAADVLGALIDDSMYEKDAGSVSDCGDAATVVLDVAVTGNRFLITCVQLPSGGAS